PCRRAGSLPPPTSRSRRGCRPETDRENEVMTHATHTVDVMRPPFPAGPGAGVYSNKLGMWVFLASDVMFFTALIGSYIVLRFGVSEPWAKPNAVLNVPLTAFNTFLLICSSVSMVKAFAAISDGNQR